MSSPHTTSGALPMEFRRIYDEQFDFVWRALRRLGVPESDRADALQDVFVVVHRKLPEFEGRSRVSTWLYAISMRVASDRRRRAHVTREQFAGEALESLPDLAPDAELQLDAKQEAAVLEFLLDQMPIDQRAVFTLFELDGCSSEEVAQLVEIPLGTVYSRLRRARASFASALTRLKARRQFQTFTLATER